MHSSDLAIEDLDDGESQTEPSNFSFGGWQIGPGRLELQSENDVDAKMLMMKLQDMSLDIKDVEALFTPVIEVHEEEESVCSEPLVVEEEEEEKSDDDSILQRMENNTDLKLLMDEIESMPIRRSDAPLFEESLMEGEGEIGCEKILKDQVDLVFRDLKNRPRPPTIEDVHAIFDGVDDDYSLDCLFDLGDGERGENIDDDTWCDALFYAGQVEGDSGDILDPEIYSLIGDNIEAVELTAYIDYISA